MIATMTLGAELLSSVFCIPEGYTISDVTFDKCNNRISLLLSSEELTCDTVVDAYYCADESKPSFKLKRWNVKGHPSLRINYQHEEWITHLMRDLNISRQAAIDLDNKT